MYHPHSLILTLALAALAAAPAPSAHAQETTEQLHQLNEQLEAKVADLQSALEAARERIRVLEAQLGSTATNTPAEKTPSDPAKDSTSRQEANSEAQFMSDPEHAEATIRAAYRAAYTSSGLPEVGSDDWGEDEGMYERWLRKWIAGTDRKFRKAVSWTVVIERSVRANRTESIATLVAWNSEEHEQIGAQFQVRIPSRTLERIYRAMRIAGGTVPLELQGIYVPHLQFNRNRIARGPFDSPPFIGPMAELRWSFDVKSLSPVRQEPERPEAVKEG